MYIRSLLLLSLIAGALNAHEPGSCDPLPFDIEQKQSEELRQDMHELVNAVRQKIGSLFQVPMITEPVIAVVPRQTNATRTIINGITTRLYNLYDVSCHNAGKIMLTATALVAVGYSVSEIIKARQQEKAEASAQETHDAELSSSVNI